MFELNGIIKLLGEKQTFQSGFEKREFVITTQEQYPNNIKLECINDKIGLLDALKQGDKINVKFRIRGNEYQGKYYVNLNAFDIKIDADSSSQEQKPQELPTIDLNEEEDDLPF